ncbi:helix-turn-helix domain-containing protein [Nocardia asteroides]|uniref:helix-turn-helix domain-containing protein n=1 Tax=Nocardia asteroides TaxID=1824 RepID=UPI0034313F7E
MAPAHLWRLERNDRRAVFACGESTVLFAGTGPGSAGAHEHPAWKLILPLGASPVVVAGEWGRVEAPAVVVPPQWPHTCTVPAGFVRVSIDAHLLATHDGPIALSAHHARRLLDALGMGTDLAGDPDLAALLAETVALCGAGTGLDPRVALALDRVDDAASLAAVARSVGLSAPRLRSLVRAQLGVPLARLRRWDRLRDAVVALPGGSVAAAAAGADFADQAHLTRTARELVGRTPSSMLL